MNARLDPVRQEIYRNLLASIAEEMGTVLRRTAYSPNIKERRDYSCAIFDGRGRLVAMGDHMPVHLGSMPLSVRAAIDAFPLHAGDIVILNDPFSGGTHLPDITLVAPLFESTTPSQPLAYLAARAHHSDVGGMSPGSMPLSREIFQEGVRIPPLKLYRGGRLQADLLRFLLYNVRTPLEREGDLAAQVGSLRVGEKRLLELAARRSAGELQNAMRGLQEYGERLMRRILAELPDGEYRAEDVLDDDGLALDPSSSVPTTLRVAIGIEGETMRVDFSGTDPQVAGSLNAVEAITLSAVYYVLRCLAPEDAPTSDGLLAPIEVVIPSGSVLNASCPAATAGGNVETSQRVVDLLLRALAQVLPDRIPAASSGTMNNLTLGGVDPSTGRPFSYYETIAGGMGASPSADGDSGIHTHMTNSLNTPVEALEHAFPLRVREYRLRRRSGGRGLHRGGDGISRRLEMLVEGQVTMLSERRQYPPYGLAGGEAGRPGANALLRGGHRKRLPGKFSIRVRPGDVISIETPGGGGWGSR